MISLSTALSPVGLLILPIGGILCFAAGYELYERQKGLRTYLKDTVVRKLLSNISQDFRYKPDGSLNSEQVKRSGFFPWPSSQMQGEDLLEGRYGETGFACSFITFGEGNRSGQKEFEGLFLIADFNKHIKGTTIAVPDGLESTLGSWLGRKIQKMMRPGMKLIHLEDPEFERYFAVYSHDQVEARYILTPDLMQRICSLKRWLQQDIYLAFKEDKVYIAIHGIKGFSIEPGHKLSPQFIANGVNYKWKLITQVIDALDLNTRIWQKQ